jgi:hypothetical protein
MAHFAGAARGGGGGGRQGRLLFKLPSIINKYEPHQSIDGDNPIAENSVDLENFDRSVKRRGTIVGDVRVVNKSYTRLRIAEFCNAYLGLIGVGLCLIEREIRSTYGDGAKENIRIWLLSINFATTIGLLISLYFAYLMNFNWMKARGIYEKGDDLINTGKYKGLIIECII